jgi:hypothetical protein
LRVFGTDVLDAMGASLEGATAALQLATPWLATGLSGASSGHASGEIIRGKGITNTSSSLHVHDPISSKSPTHVHMHLATVQ